VADEPIHEGVEFLGVLVKVRRPEHYDEDYKHVAHITDHPPGV
jgi:hypothetical protein